MPEEFTVELSEKVTELCRSALALPPVAQRQLLMDLVMLTGFGDEKTLEVLASA